MFAKATKSRFFAVFVVMMLMLCSVAVIADADASPYGGVTTNKTDEKNQEFTVQMSVGQTFTYSGITTNLSGEGYGTVTYDWSGTAKDNGISLNGTELKGKFGTAGQYTGTLKATWTGPDAGTDGKTPTQTATQTITFNVDEKITIATTTTAYALVGWTGTNTVLTLDCGGSTDKTKTGTEVITDSYKYGSDKHANNDTHFKATYDPSTKKVTVKPSEELTEAAGPEYIHVTLTNPNTGDTQTGEIILYIYDKIAITSTTTHYYTYEGDTTYSATGFVFSVNYDDDSKEETVVDEKTMTFGPSGQTVLTADANSTEEEQAAFNYKHVNIATPYTSVGALTGGAISKDYTATLDVKGSVTSALGDSKESEASQIFTLTVYKALAFTSAPAVENVTAKAISTGSNNTMTLSANLSGAKFATINWGDGQTSNRTAASDVSLYNAKHTYASSGTYLITVTAENDVGTTTSKVMYSVNTSADTTPDTTDSDKKTGFFDQHGYLFLVFILILVGLLVAYFYFGIQHPFVLLLAIVCAVLAVALYVYGDFGGIIDALKGSK